MMRNKVLCYRLGITSSPVYYEWDIPEFIDWLRQGLLNRKRNKQNNLGRTGSVEDMFSDNEGPTFVDRPRSRSQPYLGDPEAERQHLIRLTTRSVAFKDEPRGVSSRTEPKKENVELTTTPHPKAKYSLRNRGSYPVAAKSLEDQETTSFRKSLNPKNVATLHWNGYNPVAQEHMYYYADTHASRNLRINAIR